MRAQRRGVIVVCLLLALGACQEDGPRASSNVSDLPDLMADQRSACERTGGRWGVRAGDTIFTCYRTAPDANKLCRVASDCSSVCLARSRTCAPITPFLGCHEILTEGGKVATQCIN